MKASLSRLLDFALYGVLALMLVKFVSRKFSGPREGTPAAVIDLPLIGESNARFRLEEHRGKPVLLEVFASWCGTCQRTAPELRRAWDRHRGTVDFLAVGVNMSSEDAARVKSDWGIPYDVALDDGHVAARYGIEVLPTFVLIGRDGRVEHVSTGSASSSDIDRWLEKL